MYISREGPDPEGVTPGSNNTPTETHGGPVIFLILSHSHRWVPEGEEERKEKLRPACQRPTSRSRPCPPAARPAPGEVARAHICHGHEQLTKILPLSHKPQTTSQGCSGIITVCLFSLHSARFVRGQFCSQRTY